MTTRSARLRLWVPLVVGALLASVCLQSLFGGRSTRFDELALGKDTTSYYARVDGYPIHCSTPKDADGCLDGFRARKSKTAALWLGNSQVHAINQMKPGDENGPPLLHDALRNSLALDLLTFSQPNASLQEHLVMFLYLRQRLPLKVLILPLVFDDLRETGLRSEIARAIEDPTTARELLRSDIGRRVLETARTTSSSSDFSGSEQADVSALKETTQEQTELALNRWLEKHSPIWKTRREARGTILTNLYFLRNRLFGITAQTARPLIPGRRELNMRALEEILSASRAADIRVVLYIAPIRGDVAIPYLPDEYLKFKTEITALAAEYGATLSNLENLIPARHWGTKGSTSLGEGQELDFMHFQAQGHHLLASALEDMVRRAVIRKR